MKHLTLVLDTRKQAFYSVFSSTSILSNEKILAYYYYKYFFIIILALRVIDSKIDIDTIPGTLN